MPLYEYQCEACGERFEVIQKFSEPPVEVCTVCGKGPVVRLISSPAIQFKGSGWYITDYARKGQAEKKGTGAADGAKSDGTKSDTTKTDAAKTEGAKAETATKSDSATKTDTSSKSPTT
jgi:putative FmdB family regulatory protein